MLEIVPVADIIYQEGFLMFTTALGANLQIFNTEFADHRQDLADNLIALAQAMVKGNRSSRFLIPKQSPRP
jgi:hypothetical protein